MAMKYKGQAKSTANLITLMLMVIALPIWLIWKLLSWIFKRG